MKKILTIFCIVLSVVLISSIFMPRKNDLDNTDTPPIVFNEISYLAFGDSITEGGNLESQSQSYPCVVGDILGFRKVTNKGVGGSTLAYYGGRNCIANDVVDFVNISSLEYQVVSITGGTNDRSWDLPIGNIDDLSVDTIYGSLNIIVRKLTRAYPNSFIFLMTPIKNRYSEEINHAGYNLEDISNAIKNIADKYDLPLLDLYNTSQFETATSGMNNANCDGTHPIKEFVADYLAPQIAQFIKDNYKK